MGYLKMKTIDFVRQFHAKQTFTIKDNFEFVEFDDLSHEDITPDSPIPDQVEIWAGVKVYFEGVEPESYKALNLLIGDWVEDHEEKLNAVMVDELHKHFQEKYPASDHSEIGEDSVIWTDQLDYMPRIDPKDKSMVIELELVLDTEPMPE